jgi:hypothetical protein
MVQQALFSSNDLRDFLDRRGRAAKATAQEVPEAKLRRGGAEAVASALAQTFGVAPLEIDFTGIEATTEEVQLDVSRNPDFAHSGRGRALHPGMRYSLHVPFTGLPELFGLESSTQTSMRPRGVVAPSGGSGGTLTLIVEVTRGQDAAPAIERVTNEQQRLIDQYIGFQRSQIDEFNQNLTQSLQATLDARLKELDSTASALAAVGIPLRRRTGSPALPIAMTQQIRIREAAAIGIAQQPPTRSGRQPERSITDEDYEGILSLIRHQCRTFEGAPEAFAKLDEEHLRDVIRASLNAIYRVAAAEAFRSHGKTDICIEAEDRSAFVAECKVWAGGQGLSEAIDQLLRYLTWRDCKTAIIVFNKDVRGFVDLLTKKVGPQLQGHPSFLRMPSSPPENGEWHVVFKQDAGTEVVCKVMLFNLHVG